VFILAADRRQLENSAKAAFGSDIDFDEYYRKFVHREVSLPEISESCYQAIASKYVDIYLQRQDLRACFMALDEHRIKNIIDLIAALRLTPRQIQEVFRVLSHLFETSQDEAGRLRWPLAVGSIAMAAFRVGHPEMYRLLGSQRLLPEKAHRFLMDLFPEESPDWWFTLFLTGDGLLIEGDTPPKAVLENLGLGEHGDIARWKSDWGRGSSRRFSQIHDKIEHILTWSS
jgi:hypothetical protein